MQATDCHPDATFASPATEFPPWLIMANVLALWAR